MKDQGFHGHLFPRCRDCRYFEYSRNTVDNFPEGVCTKVQNSANRTYAVSRACDRFEEKGTTLFDYMDTFPVGGQTRK